MTRAPIQSPTAASPEPAGLRERRVIGNRYRIVERVHFGVAGSTYLAEDLHDGKLVILRALEERSGHALPILARLWSHARRLTSLSHPGAARVHAIPADCGVYVSREYVEGVSMAELCTERLPLAQVQALGVQVAEVLAAAHAEGVVHGHLTPENVFLLPDGSVKITDFGLAWLLLRPLPRLGQSVDGNSISAADLRGDLHALGVIIYRALTGEPAAFANTRGDELPAPSSLGPEIPVEWDVVVARLIGVSPQPRIPSAAAAAEALADLPAECQSPAAVDAKGRVDDTVRLPSGRAEEESGAADAGDGQPDAIADVAATAPAPDSRLIAAAALVAIAGAETVTAYVNPLAGVLIHITLLMALLTVSAITDSPRLQAFLLAISTAPLIRVVSLGMPLGRFPQELWYVLTAAPLFAAAVVVCRSSGLSRRDIHLRMPSGRQWPLQALVACTGVGLGGVEWRILGARAIVDGHSLLLVGVAAIVLLTCTGFLEELLFRGLIQTAASSLLGPNAGLLFTALVFAALHIGWKSPADLAFVFAVAMYFGLVVRYTRSLVGVTLSHGAINTMLFVVLPLALH